MLEFKVIQELEPNNEILNIINNSTFTTKNGRVKHLLKTNLQFIEPTSIEYRTTTVSFANYPYIMFAMAKFMEMDSSEQNKVALFLFNSIDYKIEKYL